MESSGFNKEVVNDTLRYFHELVEREPGPPADKTSSVSAGEVNTKDQALAIINSTNPSKVNMKKALQRLSKIARYSDPDGGGSPKDHPTADEGLANLLKDDVGIHGTSPDESTIRAELIKVLPTLQTEPGLDIVYAFLISVGKDEAHATLNMIVTDGAITGGRRRRKSRKARKSRRSRRARRSRRSRRYRTARMMV
jgi:hypothetical protein